MAYVGLGHGHLDIITSVTVSGPTFRVTPIYRFEDKMNSPRSPFPFLLATGLYIIFCCVKYDAKYWKYWCSLSCYGGLIEFDERYSKHGYV